MSIVRSLSGFVRKLIGRFGLGRSSELQEQQIFPINSSDGQLRFLLEILQSIKQNNGDPQVIYPLLRQNLELLDDRLISVLETWTRATIAESESDVQRSIAALIWYFGNLIQDFPLGNKAVNMELAIASYDLALEVHSVEIARMEWAMTQNNLATAYLYRIRGDRGENLEQSIACYEAALEVRTKKDLPIQWATTQNNLANAYLYRIRGDRGENLEQSIACYEAALEVYTKKDLPIDWAMTQNNLANAYSDRIRGDRGENLEQSIACYEAALEVRTKKDLPIDWAMTQNNLANAYIDRIRGDRGENLEQSIACYEAALEVYTKKDLPIDWAMTQNNLANAYSDRIRGDRGENLEQSIACYEAALEVRTKKDLPIDWAMTQNNLANAYIDRIRGDRGENLEQSISCYEAALEVRTKKDLPIDWAMTQNNLANAYIDRIRGDRGENLEQSIACYEAALEVLTKKDLPIDWAKTQNNLANAYLYRIRGDRGENLEQSIACSEAALEVRTKKDLPIDWAMTQNNLALALSDRIRGDRGENLEQSISCYEAALEVYTKKDLPIDWAMTQNNLANAYNQRIRGDRGENLELSIKGFLSALEVRTPKTLPIDCLQSAENLGNLHFNEGQWPQAITAFEIAMEAAETSRSWSVDDGERQRILQQALSVYENSIQCAVNLGNYQQAIAYTERVRSRQLVELMASKDLYSDAQVPPEIQAYLAEYQQLSQEIADLHEEGTEKLVLTKTSRDSEDLRKTTAQIQQVEARKQLLYGKIRTYDPVMAGQIAVAPITQTDIQKLITNDRTAILTFYSNDQDTHIFILKYHQEPEIFTVQTQGKQELQNWLINNWLLPYNQDSDHWQTKMPEVLAEIAQRLQLNQLITNHLNGIEELILVPHLLLHQIPFSALPIPETTQLLGEKFTLRFAPSCQILQYCQQRPAIATTIQGLVEDADDSLIGARYEGHKIAEICKVEADNRLRGKTQATVANYRELLSRVNRLHSSHHASSRLDNPLESALILADGKITLGDLLLGKRYPNLDEVFLSACETHVGTFTLTDDVTTITTGFLCAGARSVQSTLWSVSDIVTALFDIFYHQERREGYNRAISLKRAQVRLKNLSGAEFRRNHYPELKKFLDIELEPELEAIDQRINQLNSIKNQVTGEERENILLEITSLEKRYLSLENLGATLESYCQQDFPFASPYYWAGFICQGMA